MGQMLKLPAELYEETIGKCQSFLNVINKVTRIAERKANLANVNTQSEEE
jgi:thioredoxin-like negative regulator of GroEL